MTCCLLTYMIIHYHCPDSYASRNDRVKTLERTYFQVKKPCIPKHHHRPFQNYRVRQPVITAWTHPVEGLISALPIRGEKMISCIQRTRPRRSDQFYPQHGRRPDRHCGISKQEHYPIDSCVSVTYIWPCWYKRQIFFRCVNRYRHKTQYEGEKKENPSQILI